MPLDNELVYDQGLIKAVFNEALERAASIADSYMTIESRAIAEDIRSLKEKQNVGEDQMAPVDGDSISVSAVRGTGGEGQTGSV